MLSFSWAPLCCELEYKTGPGELGRRFIDVGEPSLSLGGVCVCGCVYVGCHIGD